MKYIIYGAGDDGNTAIKAIGADRVEAFCDNGRAGNTVQGKPVLSFEQLKKQYCSGSYIIIVATSKFQTEIVLQLKLNGIDRFWVFNWKAHVALPTFLPHRIVQGESQLVSYAERLAEWQVSRYHHIGISNVNPSLNYLISEIAFQCNGWRIDYIILDDAETSTSYMGIPVVRSEEALGHIDCLVINEPEQKNDIRSRLPESPGFAVLDIMNPV